MKLVTQMILSLLLLTASAWAQSSSPVGLWQTVDDKTGAPRAVIEIFQDPSGALSGKVVKGMDPGEPVDKRCTACTDARKDQAIVGMTVLTGMRQVDDEWQGGEILDPDNGRVYKCKMHLQKGGAELVVRGFIGFSLLGRSQTWMRSSG